MSGNGGIVGLTEDKDKFRGWQICSPEVARVVSEFEDITVLKGNEHSEFYRHEDFKAFQEKFANHVALLTTEFNQLGNPFGPDELKELVQLAKDVMTDNVVCTVRNIEEIGRKQQAEFRETTIFRKSIRLDDTIKKNKLPTFKTSNTKGRSAKTESLELKMHVRLFSQMHISTQIVEEIWWSSSAMELCSIPHPWQGVAKYALETNLISLSASNPFLIHRQSVTNQKCQLLFWKVPYW